MLTRTNIGSLLVKIRKQYPNWPVTALVRKDAHVAPVRAAGVSVVQATAGQDQLALIAEQAYKADITINAADCDDVQLCKTFLGAMKKRVEDGKPKGVFLHTSGTMLFNDASADGKRVNGKYWNVSTSIILAFKNLYFSVLYRTMTRMI